MDTPDRRIRLKHTMTDANDCELLWDVDFAKMILTMRANFISPYLLLSFLNGLHHCDDRFGKTKIISAVQITNRFDVRLELPSGAIFKLHAYQPFSISETWQEPKEIEFFELPKE
jgi:hypothetical protein